MAIPESQLDTWSSQGAMAGSRDTYNAIKSMLEARDAPYADKYFSVYLQGSYGNDTNIYSESDVDIVIQLSSAFHYELDSLSLEQKLAFQLVYSGGVDYALPNFKQEVLDHLQKRYGAAAITTGAKAITIAANNTRRKADIIVCLGHRQYHNFKNEYEQYYDEGISFFNTSNTLIANYPKQHSKNCTTKHQNTSRLYKPIVRIFKNIRNRLIIEGMINEGDTPSYFIEGMLYNVPDFYFDRSFGSSISNSLSWLNGTDPSQLLCANEKYFLLNDQSPVTWRTDKYIAFLHAACALWQQW